MSLETMVAHLVASYLPDPDRVPQWGADDYKHAVRSFRKALQGRPMDIPVAAAEAKLQQPAGKGFTVRLAQARVVVTQEQSDERGVTLRLEVLEGVGDE